MTQTPSEEATYNTLLNDAVENRLKSLRTQTPGIIQSFDASTGRAEIQPAIKSVLVTGGETRFVALPKVINCPIGNLKAGGFVVTLPVKAGDECMICFTERSLDAWIKFGDIRQPNDLRLHSISDAYFIPMSTSEPKATQNYDVDNMVLRNEANDLKITLDTMGNITIDATQKVTVNASDVEVNSTSDTVVNASGDADINASGDCNINGTTINNNGNAAGVVTTLSINPVTGTPFPNGSATLRNVDG